MSRRVRSERLDPDRHVRRYGNRCLRVECRPAEPGAPETGELVRRLWRVLEAGTGVGLAAPQIGSDLRVLVVHDPEAEKGRERHTMINPEIVEFFGERAYFEEGCLSFPGLYTDIERPVGVVVNYQDESGHRHQIRDEGMLARIVQHELDHLDGILFVDRLPLLRRVLLWPHLLSQALGHVFWTLRRGK